MSPLPSPLKSAVPAIVHAVSTTPMLADEVTVVPLMNHIARLPLVSRHNRSCLPSPLKSRCALMVQKVDTVPRPTDCPIDAPFISHSATWPPLPRQAMSLLLLALKSCELGAIRVQMLGNVPRRFWSA